MLKSENARLNGWTFVDIRGVDLGSYVRQAQQAVSEQVDLPPGYSITWSGQYEYMLRAQQRLAQVVPLTLIIIFVLLYLSFRRVGEAAAGDAVAAVRAGGRLLVHLAAGLRAVGGGGGRLHRAGRRGRRVRRGHADLSGQCAEALPATKTG